jgi:hypothetical protein
MTDKLLEKIENFKNLKTIGFSGINNTIFSLIL